MSSPFKFFLKLSQTLTPNLSCMDGIWSVMISSLSQRNAKDDQPNPFKFEFKDAQAFIRALGGHMVTNLRAKFSFAQSHDL